MTSNSILVNYSICAKCFADRNKFNAIKLKYTNSDELPIWNITNRNVRVCCRNDELELEIIKDVLENHKKNTKILFSKKYRKKNLIEEVKTKDDIDRINNELTDIQISSRNYRKDEITPILEKNNDSDNLEMDILTKEFIDYLRKYKNKIKTIIKIVEDIRINTD